MIEKYWPYIVGAVALLAIYSYSQRTETNISVRQPIAAGFLPDPNAAALYERRQEARLSDQLLKLQIFEDLLSYDVINRQQGGQGIFNTNRAAQASVRAASADDFMMRIQSSPFIFGNTL